jgi:hypothetical protein
VGIALAYAVWQGEPAATDANVVVIDATRNEVRKVRYEDDKHWFELERGEDAHGEPVLWLRKSEDAAAKTPRRELLGSEAAERFLEAFGPLRAKRALGVIDAAKQKELGLEGTRRKLTVTTRGEQRQFSLGSRAPYENPYFKDERDGKVYVPAADLAASLQAPDRLIDARLHRVEKSDWDGATVSFGGKRKDLVQLSPLEPTASKIAPKAHPDKPDEMAKNWLDRIWFAAGAEALGKGEEPASGKPDVLVRVDYTARGKPRAWIDLARVAPPASPAPAMSEAPEAAASKPAAPAAPPPKSELFVRTEHTVGWVKLHQSPDEVVKEAEKIVSGN